MGSRTEARLPKADVLGRLQLEEFGEAGYMVGVARQIGELLCCPLKGPVKAVSELHSAAGRQQVWQPAGSHRNADRR